MLSRTPYPLLGVVLAILIAVWTLPGERAISLEGAAKVEYLLRALETGGDFKVRIAAADGLGKIADGTVADWMVRAFRQETNPAVRLAILYAVGAIPDHRILPPVLEVANEEVLSDVEFLAIERILWNFRAAFAVNEWERTAIYSTDRSERATAAWLLGIAGRPSSLHTLLLALTDREAYVRLRAVQGITRLGMKEGQPACARAARADPDIVVRREAANCITMIGLMNTGRLPDDRNHRVNLKSDLSGLETAAVTPETFRSYLKKNVNPRAVDVAAAALRPNQVEERKDRTIPLVTDERIRDTFKLDASVITAYLFRTSELNRLRETVREQAGSVNQCYLRGLAKHPHLGGSVTLRFRVLATGVVSEVEVPASTLPDEEVTACIAGKVKEIRFPSIPLAFVTMNYTYTFAPPKDEKIEF
ncbi:MAG: AgmX/PglI C-terminal domain-containing protein [Pseudomonadota bacterium]